MKLMRSLILYLFVSMVASAARSAEGVVNIGSGLPTEDNHRVILTRAQLVSILMTQKVFWDNGVKITVFLLPRDNIATKEFLTRLGIPPNAYFDSISSQYSSGKSNVPTVLQTDISMLLNVGNTVGSIGYVNNSGLIEVVPTIRPIQIGDPKK